MKKIFALFACVAGLTGGLQAQTATIRIDAGYLYNATGTGYVPTGMLLQILASPSGVFSAPTTSSYVTGDNVLLGNFAMNYNGGTGETLTNDTFSLSSFNLTAGEALLLRFYPSLSGTTVPTTPTLGTTYGQVRSSTTETSITDGSQTAWVVPAAGATVDLLYITTNNGGNYADATAFASNVVLAPEPSTYMIAIVGVAILGLTVSKRKRTI